MITEIKPRLLLVVLSSLAMVAGCSSTRNTASNQEMPVEIVDNGYTLGSERNANQSNMMVYPNRDRPSNMSLNDMLRRLPGLRVQGGNGPDAKITVTGSASSFIANTDPLFVLNGQTMGSNYAQVYAIVNPNDVVSLSVLKGSDATLYGSRGANGVILIRTK